MIKQLGLDPGLALVLALSLFPAMPLALNPGLPAGVDLAAHSALAAELARNMPGAPLYAADVSLAHLWGGLLQRALGFSILDAWRS